jgi:PmbA protein
MRELQHTAQHVIERAQKSGATAADVMIREEDTFSVTVRMGEIETLKEAISRNLMLRVFVGKRTATSHTSDLSEVPLEAYVGGRKRRSSRRIPVPRQFPRFEFARSQLGQS